MTESKRPNYIADAWLIIVLAILFGVALAGTQMALGGRIAQNKLNETVGLAHVLVPGAAEGKAEALMIKDQAGRDVRVFKTFDAEGKQIGWLVPASGQGFADKIEVVIGVDTQVTSITGIAVIDQKETPGLGDLITGEPFTSQYRGKSTSAALGVVKTGPGKDNEIIALTGATISSVAVTDIVNQQLAGVREALLAALAAEPKGN
ncbi:MAG: FMN-binding protein [Myxococcota bacterium]|nr:FMN-binding protein [Myxococcota bacterium]